MKYTFLLYPVLVFLFYSFSFESAELSTEASNLYENQDDQLDKPFALYPNPAGSKVTVKSNYFNEVRPDMIIYNASGSKIMGFTSLKFDEEDEFIINLNEVASGLYFVQLRSGNYSATKKLIKVK